MTGLVTGSADPTGAGTPVGEYCGRCGNPQAEGDHAGCLRALALEPPRYCEQCRRRLIVQVFPTGWTARCSAHGELR